MPAEAWVLVPTDESTITSFEGQDIELPIAIDVCRVGELRVLVSNVCLIRSISFPFAYIDQPVNIIIF